MLRYLSKMLFPIVLMADGDDGNGGGDGGDWQANLPENVRDWDEVKNSDSSDKFWKQMSDMRSYIGQSIRIPGENASAEDHKAFNEKLLSKVPGLLPVPDLQNEESVNQFYNAIGRPEKADGYTMPTFDDKGVKLDDGPAKEFMSLAHKHGLTDAQFQGIVKDMTAVNIEKAVAAHNDSQEQMTKLKNEWGLAYENNLKKVLGVADKTGAPKPLLDALKAGQIDIETGKWLLGIANSFGKEGINVGDDKGDDSVMSPAAAKQEISDIMNNKDHAYWDKSKAGHVEAKEYVKQLYEMAYPGKSSGGTVGVGGGIQPQGG